MYIRRVLPPFRGKIVSARQNKLSEKKRAVVGILKIIETLPIYIIASIALLKIAIADTVLLP